MVIQKRAKKCSEQAFCIGNQAIDVVEDYTYLGTKISSSGNFKISLDHLIKLFSPLYFLHLLLFFFLIFNK